jgi:RimJ/RimL family protein N-acetyltransferase
MPPATNHLGQPVGFAVPDWVPAKLPPRTVMAGRWCRVEPLDMARHGAALFAAYAEDREGRIWSYLPYGPFETRAEFQDWMTASCLSDDPLFHAIVEGASGRALGLASYLRVVPEAGVIEVGHINYAPALQRCAAATEAMYLMMARVFDELGNRRYEWKCDALNADSRAAAGRLGFSFEGVFRQATLYKGRNRDTAWYAITDRDWPALKAAYEAWLDPANFDAEGGQKARLSEFMPKA